MQAREGPTTGIALGAISSHAGSSSARKAATTRWVTALGTTLRYIARCSAAKPNIRDAVGVPLDVGAGRGEGHGDRCRDRIVAVGEVSVEDLPADAGPGDEVTDGELVDGSFVGQRERGVAQQVRTRSARGSALCVRAAMSIA